MGFLKTFFFTFLAFQTIHAQNSCQPQFCGTNPLPIRFPFSLQDSQQPQNCGYPGFSLTCSEQESKIRTPVLNLPYGGNFSVRDINYLMQEIHLFDPNGCLPGKLLSLNLTSSPFAASYARNFTFLRCPPGVKIATVECLSNSTAAVVATSSESLVTSMNGTCSTMFSVGVPVSWSGDDWLSSGLSGDLRLTWSFPDCQGCVAQGRVCGYQQNSTSSQIVCNFDSKRVVAASDVSRTDEIRNMTGCKVIYSQQTPVSQVFDSVYNGIDSDLQLAWNDPRLRGDHRGKPGALSIILISAITISTAFLAALFCIGCCLSAIVVMLDIEEVDSRRLWSYSTRVWKMARIKLSSPRQQPQASAPMQAAGPLDGVSFMVSARPEPRLPASRVVLNDLSPPRAPGGRAVAAIAGESSPTPSSPSVAAEPLYDFFPPMPAPSIDELSSTPSSPSVAADPHDDFLVMYLTEVREMADEALDEFSFVPPYDNEFFFDAAHEDELPTEDLIIGGSQCISGPNGNSCTICLGEYKASERLKLVRKCNHCFHADCLERWLQRKNNCPICRTDVI